MNIPISFNIIIIAFVVFCSAFVVHIITWNIHRPKQHITALFLVFVVLPFILISSAVGISYTTSFFIISLNDAVLVLVLTGAFAGVYIQTYPAIQAASPTLVIMYALGKKPLSFESLQSHFSGNAVIQERLDDLCKEGLAAVSENGVLTLRKKGRILALLFTAYRKCIGLGDGGG